MLMRVHHPIQVGSTAESHAATESIAFNFQFLKSIPCICISLYAFDRENFLQKILFEPSEEKHSETTANKA